MTSLEHRRQVALHQLDAFIDVMSGWRCRYEDDDWHAGIGWIMAVIPEDADRGDDWKRGWLCVTATLTPGIGWRFLGPTGSVFAVSSLCRSLRGTPFTEITRKQFRSAAEQSGVTLPSRHATLYLSDPEPTRKGF